MLKADVFFFLNGQVLARRRWSLIPRAGDYVILGDDSASFRVKRVTFGVEGPTHDHLTQQCINIDVVPTE